MIKQPIIIATIASYYSSEQFEIIDQLLEVGISYLRFNLSKFENTNDVQRRCEYISKLKKHFGSKIEIMLDLPYPGRKPRIFVPKEMNGTIVEKNEVIHITSNDKQIIVGKKIFKVDDENVVLNLREGQNVIYSDGEGFLVVEGVCEKSNTISLKALNEIMIFNNKSLSYNRIVNNIGFLDSCIGIVMDCNPKSVALSFVTSANEVADFTDKCLNHNIEVVSKIESKKAVINVDEICDISHIMLARGDLLLNTNRSEFTNYQNYIINKVNSAHKNLFIATGILSSFKNRLIPTQSDLVDLRNVLEANPYAIILNSDLVHNNIGSAMNLISKTVHSINNPFYKQKDWQYTEEFLL